MRDALLWPGLFALALLPGAALGKSATFLHEPIPPDPQDDAALGVALAGDMPAMMETSSGLVHAPDPRRPDLPTDKTYGAQNDLPTATYMADRDTRRPSTLPYDDPFNPSTAPFKRLIAFDAVDASFRLYVRDPALAPVPVQSPLPSDDRFYGDVKVDLASDRHVRIPSVGPGTKLIHAAARAGSKDVAVRVVRDGAENWFVDLVGPPAASARLVLELAIPRDAFGGDFGDPEWSALRPLAPIPPNVAESAERVNRHIGVDRSIRPREAVRKLVTYYRGFVDSDEPPRPASDVYQDLALSRKGVCRHRAFAFAISALALGLPTRMVMNEAHAWVEVHDGAIWKRIDLGGAGRALASDMGRADVPYEPPPDPFAWPQNAERGDDLADRARAQPPSSSRPSNPIEVETTQRPRAPGDRRPAAKVSLSVQGASALRGDSVHLSGNVSADGEPCANVRVDVVLVGASRALLLGSVATDDRGRFDRQLVLPPAVPLGDYEVRARTVGDVRCGPGESP